MSGKKVDNGFEQLGVQVKGTTGNQKFGVCPFCDGDKKFYFSPDSGMWDCKKCGEKGNIEQFIDKMHGIFADCKATELQKLAEDRGIPGPIMREYGVGVVVPGEYCIPVRNIHGHVINMHLYKIGDRSIGVKGGHNFLITPKTMSNSKRVWICEGEWDGMALHDAITRGMRLNEDVISLCGASVFPIDATQLFQNKDVICCLDKDKAGVKGNQKIKRMLTGIAKSVRFVRWPDEMPEGYDVRDHYKALGKESLVDNLLTMLVKEPETYGMLDDPKDASTLAPTHMAGTGATAKEAIEWGDGADPEKVVRVFKRWLYMPNTEALEVMFGTIFANRLGGDPLWLFLVGPSGCGKSELLMSLTDAPLVEHTTTLTPQSLMSGAQMMGGMDPSLIPQLDGKVLVVKDFTAILNMNQMAQDEVFGILRDAYDGKTSKRFGNGVVRTYESRFGVLSGVTPAIETVGQRHVVLGERFIRYRFRFVDTDSFMREAMRKAIANTGKEEQMRSALQKATLSVLNREVTSEDIPHLPHGMMERIMNLAHWASRMRGAVAKDRYTGQILFRPTAEVGTRLAKQLVSLAYGISIWRREDEVSERTYDIIAHTARSTTPDRVDEVVKYLYLYDSDGFMSTKDIAEKARFPSQTILPIMEDLHVMGMVEQDSGSGFEYTWRLSATMRKVMNPLNLYRSDAQWIVGLRRAKNEDIHSMEVETHGDEHGTEDNDLREGRVRQVRRRKK